MATNNAWNNTITDADVTLNGGDVNIATDAAAHTVTIGNTTGATAVNMNIGTGDFTMSSASGTLISQLDTGEMTKPLQPLFSVENSSDVANVTGDGTLYAPAQFNLEIVDIGSNFSANVFTAPVTGNYIFTVTYAIYGLDGTHTTNTYSLIVNGVTTYALHQLIASPIRWGAQRYHNTASKIISLTAGDTMEVGVAVSGSTKTVGWEGSSPRSSTFAGYLVS